MTAAARLRADLSGVNAVVTGGTKGIGRAVVRQLVANGARVAFQGRDPAAAESLLGECRGDSGKAYFVPGDVSSFQDAQALVAHAVSAFGRLDVYVSSGGPRAPSPKLFADMPTPSDSLAMIESRLAPRLNALHAAVPQMRSQGFGKIVLLTTDAARTPTPSESMIGAAGASVMFLTRALAKELAGYGIRINAVATTITSGTPPYDAFLAAREAGSGEVIVKAFEKAHAKAQFRINTPDDLAAYVLYLASPAADQVSGSTLSINGGLSFPSY
jgi:2-hydroxycyclohexanecarboxyl-CoA dehydrogenase